MSRLFQQIVVYCLCGLLVCSWTMPPGLQHSHTESENHHSELNYSDHHHHGEVLHHSHEDTLHHSSSIEPIDTHLHLVWMGIHLKLPENNEFPENELENFSQDQLIQFHEEAISKCGETLLYDLLGLPSTTCISSSHFTTSSIRRILRMETLNHLCDSARRERSGVLQV